jgi:hypothetical protein
LRKIDFLSAIIFSLFVLSCQEKGDENISGVETGNLKKSDLHGPVPLGCMRGNFDGIYLEFTSQIEKVQPIDSFSNCYFYGDNPKIAINQINLIRIDSAYFLAIFINGYPLDSLPTVLPVPSEFCKYSEIQFSRLPGFNWGPQNYVLDDFYGQSVFITDRTNDILRGTFAGILRDSEGNTVEVTDGEFNIQIVRKYMPVDENYGQ